jgi:uncharacterized SAM-binding protein YcdF (DUF218 family)
MLSDKEFFLILASSSCPKKADAVILLEGDGFSRIDHACSLINQGYVDYFVFSGGIEDLSYGSYGFERCLPQILKNNVDRDLLIHESKSKHTLEQAEEVIDICVKKNWSSIILVASHYHQFRAFLTFINVLIKRGLDKELKIFNSPVHGLSWTEENNWGQRLNLLESEFEKIDKYRELGHLADYKSAKEYLQWTLYL